MITARVPRQASRGRCCGGSRLPRALAPRLSGISSSFYATASALVFNKLFLPTFDPLIGSLAALGHHTEQKGDQHARNMALVWSGRRGPSARDPPGGCLQCGDVTPSDPVRQALDRGGY